MTIKLKLDKVETCVRQSNIENVPTKKILPTIDKVKQRKKNL